MGPEERSDGLKGRPPFFSLEKNSNFKGQRHRGTKIYLMLHSMQMYSLHRFHIYYKEQNIFLITVLTCSRSSKLLYVPSFTSPKCNC